MTIASIAQSGEQNLIIGNLIAHSGSIGIGTATPASRLHISAGDASLSQFGPNATWAGVLVIGASSNQIGNKKAHVISTDGNLHLDSGTTSATYINYYSQTNTYINAQAGSVGVGTTTPSYKLHINGTGYFANDVTLGATIYNSNWYRSYGTTGWYNQTYGGGIFMEDSATVKIYGGKNFAVSGSGSFGSSVLCLRGGTGYVADGNYLAGLDGLYGSSYDGFWLTDRPGYSSASWQHNHNGSVGTIQWSVTYGGALYRRNRTDNSYWTAWRQVD